MLLWKGEASFATPSHVNWDEKFISIVYRDKQKLTINNFNYFMKLSNYTHPRDQLRRKRRVARSMPPATLHAAAAAHALCIYYYYYFLPLPDPPSKHLSSLFIKYLPRLSSSPGSSNRIFIKSPQAFKLCLSLQWNSLSNYTRLIAVPEGGGR